MNKTTGVALDEKTTKLCDDFGTRRGLSRSAVIRLCINEFFINRGDANEV